MLNLSLSSVTRRPDGSPTLGTLSDDVHVFDSALRGGLVCFRVGAGRARISREDAAALCEALSAHLAATEPAPAPVVTFAPGDRVLISDSPATICGGFVYQKVAGKVATVDNVSETGNVLVEVEGLFGQYVGPAHLTPVVEDLPLIPVGTRVVVVQALYAEECEGLTGTVVRSARGYWTGRDSDGDLPHDYRVSLDSGAGAVFAAIVEPVEEPLAAWERELLGMAEPQPVEPVKPKPPVLQVGDVVRTIDDRGDSQALLGVPAVVVDVERLTGEGGDFVTATQADGATLNVYAKRFEIVTQPADHEIPGFAPGDVVEVLTDYPSNAGLTKGEAVEIVNLDGCTASPSRGVVYRVRSLSAPAPFGSSWVVFEDSLGVISQPETVPGFLPGDRVVVTESPYIGETRQAGATGTVEEVGLKWYGDLDGVRVVLDGGETWKFPESGLDRVFSRGDRVEVVGYGYGWDGPATVLNVWPDGDVNVRRLMVGGGLSRRGVVGSFDAKNVRFA